MMSLSLLAGRTVPYFCSPYCKQYYIDPDQIVPLGAVRSSPEAKELLWYGYEHSFKLLI